MKKTNLLVLAGALIIGSGALASCTKKSTTSADSQTGTSAASGNTEKTKVTLKVWSAVEDEEFIKQTATKFQEANQDKEYNIEFEGVSEANAVTQVQKDIDAAADVFHFAGDQLVPLTNAGALYQLPTAFVNKLGFADGVLAAGQVDGKQYGIPFTPNTYFMYYDSSVYTADDVKSLDAMLAKDTGYTYNIAIDLDNGWYGQSFFYSAGSTMENSATTKGFEDHDGSNDAAAKLLYSLAKNSKVVNDGGNSIIGSKATGGCGAFISGTWDSGAAQTALGENYACAPLPSLTYGETTKAWKAVGDYKQIGVNSQSKVAVDAAKFAAFLSSAEIQKLRYDLRQTAPTNESVTGIESAAVNAQTLTLANTFEQPGTAYDANSYWSTYEGFYTSLSGAADEAAAVAEFNSWNAKLDKSVAAA